MIQKTKLLKVGLILTLLYMLVGWQQANAAAISAGASGDWSSTSTWTGGVVPTINDDVTIGAFTVDVNGQGQTYYCKSLTLNNASSILRPKSTLTGDEVNLVVLGNILESNAAASLKCVNGNGRLNIIIGDGSAGISSTITPGVSYNAGTGAGIWLSNLTVNSANVTFANSNHVWLSGNITLQGNATVNATNDPYLVLYGGFTTGYQTITVPSSASLSFNYVYLQNFAQVTTSSNMNFTGTGVNPNLRLDPNTTFTATGGTIYFDASAHAVTGWTVDAAATLKLWNVDISGDGNNTVPTGDIQVQGNFVKSGTGDFHPTTNKVIFNNVGSVGEIINSGASSLDLQFNNIDIAAGSTVTSSSDYTVNNNFTVNLSASYSANNGTIHLLGTAGTITNLGTFFPFNVTIGDGVLASVITTTDSWKVAGDFTVTAAATFTANNGTITFQNTQQKTITNTATGALTFFKLAIATDSKIVTAVAPDGDFTISNNVTNKDGAGLAVLGTGQFTVTSAASILTFDGAPGAANHAKVISKSSSGTLILGMLAIAATANNDVTTASDFTIKGAGAAAFNNAGTGTFTATAGTVTFIGANPVIINITANAVKFYNLATTGATVLTVTAAEDIHIKGNLTVDGTGQFAGADETAIVKFTGTTQQIIAGSSTHITGGIADAVKFGTLVINGLEVLMNRDVAIMDAATAGTLTLTSGILNLGSKTLACYAGTITYPAGTINGGTGTYIVGTGHAATTLANSLFLIDGTPTLYNLKVAAANSTGDDLTVNGTLTLAANLTLIEGTAVTPKLLTLNGNFISTGGTLINSAGHPDRVRLVLQGSGSTTGFSDLLFDATPANDMCITVGRPELLTGNLTMGTNANLTINTGVGAFNIQSNTLTLDGTGGIKVISGSITAPFSSTVDFNTLTDIPANLFTGNSCGSLISTTASDLTLLGDLTVTATLNIPATANIVTGNNIVTFGPLMTITNAFGTVAVANVNSIVGNLRRTVTGGAQCEFAVGNGKVIGYRPIKLQFATATSSQLITVSSKQIEPTYGRGGDPINSVNLLWTITSEGSTPVDSASMEFHWSNDNTIESSTHATVANASFPAKWLGTNWSDYRTTALYTVANPRIITMSGFPVKASALSGDWAVFNATANTNTAKDKAISVAKNRIVITNIDPMPVVSGQAFTVTVQLQDPYGQPIVATTNCSIDLSTEQGTAPFTLLTTNIPAGSSSLDIRGLTLTSAGGESNYQFRVDTTGTSIYWQATASEAFSILPAVPSPQLSTIGFSNVAATSITVTWVNATGANCIVVAKADTLLTTSEFPVSGSTYIANSIYGAGSSIGNAAVIYKGTGTTVDVTCLAPNTIYYFYVFRYAGSDGNERYNTTAASRNPNTQLTSGTDDDDVTYGDNDSWALSKTIGTNTPVRGTIKSSTDVDWFNFSVTNAVPNVRVTLTDLPANYNVEIYNSSLRRMRRATLTGSKNESIIINNLTPGTYTVKLYGVDGAYNVTTPYNLKVETKSSEIFSVTP